jgi:hypothetical protein
MAVEPGEGEVPATPSARIPTASQEWGIARAMLDANLLGGRLSNAGETLSRKSPGHRRAANDSRLRRDPTLDRR